jgi:hypothetical protein
VNERFLRVLHKMEIARALIPRWQGQGSVYSAFFRIAEQHDAAERKLLPPVEETQLPESVARALHGLEQLVSEAAARVHSESSLRRGVRPELLEHATAQDKAALLQLRIAAAHMASTLRNFHFAAAARRAGARGPAQLVPELMTSDARLEGAEALCVRALDLLDQGALAV